MVLPSSQNIYYLDNEMNHQRGLRWDDGLEMPAKKIAEFNHSPIRVLAGPGTGKTFALMRRVARLLQEGVNPRRILVCTFTRMAAQDLKRELTDLEVIGADQVCSEILHAFCFRLLVDTEVFDIIGRELRPLLEFEKRFLLQDMSHDSFGNVEERKQRLNAFAAAWARLQSEEPGWPATSADKQFQQDLNAWLRFHKAMLIEELVPESLKFLRENLVSHYRHMFDHVLIDEYQDLNCAEQKLLDLLADRDQVLVIGDENQSIYSFKHSHPEGIASFNQVHSQTEDIELKECRRCPKVIVRVANELISNNQNRASHNLIVRSENPEGELVILQWKNMNEEGQGIAKIIESRKTRRFRSRSSSHSKSKTTVWR